MALVNNFTKTNFLKLNLSKCEIVMFSRSPQVAIPACEVDGSVLPASSEGKCLGFWWKSDLLATRAVEDNIKKAQTPFFHYGSICRFLEDDVGTAFTEAILKGEEVGPRQRREEIRASDKQQLPDKCRKKSLLIAEVVVRVGWAKLWDACFSLGVEHTTGLQKLSMAMAHHGRGSHPCPICEDSHLEEDSALEHIVRHHGDKLNLLQGCSVGEILGHLQSLNLSFLPVPKFRKLYNLY